jgi:hypothetical protein
MLTRDEILAASDLAVEELTVKAWGGKVRIRAMNGEDREAFEIADHKANRKHHAARVVAYCVVDDAGNRIFSDADIDALAKKNGDALLDIVVRAKRLNGMMPGEVAEEVKN